MLKSIEKILQATSGTMSCSHWPAIVTDNDVDVEPSLDMAQRTAISYVSLESLHSGSVKEESVGSATAHLGAKAFK